MNFFLDFLQIFKIFLETFKGTISSFLPCNKTIGIFGDSWSCGVWDTINNEYRVSHLGINHYLYTDNFHSTNFSSPGSCNNENLNNLKRYHHDFDIKLFVITEPFRDFYYKSFC